VICGGVIIMQTTIFDFINKRVQGFEGSRCRGTVPVPLKSTTKALINTKVGIDFYGREITATIDALNITYPDTAYNISWRKQDNPGEDIPVDCAGRCSNVHYSQVKIVTANAAKSANGLKMIQN
jgi:hypothetical protein